MMADRMAAEIEIGGTLRHEDVPKLIEAFGCDGVGTTWGVRNAGSMSIEALVGDTGTIHVMDDEARNGELQHIEAACRQLGLTYIRKSEGKCECAPEIAWWTPGMTEPNTITTNADHEVVISQEQITPIITLLEEGKPDHALVELKRLFPELPAIPRLEVT
jgi:hypothetical protein